MQIAADNADEEVPRVGLVLLDALGLELWHHVVHDSVELVRAVEVGDVATGKEIVEVYKEALVRDLRVRKQEHHTFVLVACLVVHPLEVLLQIGDAVCR